MTLIEAFCFCRRAVTCGTTSCALKRKRLFTRHIGSKCTTPLKSIYGDLYKHYRREMTARNADEATFVYKRTANLKPTYLCRLCTPKHITDGTITHFVWNAVYIEMQLVEIFEATSLYLKFKNVCLELPAEASTGLNRAQLRRLQVPSTIMMC
jgi:hypothetical protein